MVSSSEFTTSTLQQQPYNNANNTTFSSPQCGSTTTQRQQLNEKHHSVPSQQSHSFWLVFSSFLLGSDTLMCVASYLLGFRLLFIWCCLLISIRVNKCKNFVLLLKIMENIYWLSFVVVCFRAKSGKSAGATSFICHYSAGFSFNILITSWCIHVLVFSCISTLYFKRLVALRRNSYTVILSYMMLYLCTLKFTFCIAHSN